jgi:hypothetical protein
MNEALQVGLQKARGHAGDGDAVPMTELEHRVAVRIDCDRSRQCLRALHVREVVELNGIGPRIEVVDGFCAFAGVEEERVVAGPADGDGGMEGGRRYRGISDQRVAVDGGNLQLSVETSTPPATATRAQFSARTAA